MTPDGKYIIAVDFDGTLIHGNKWPDVAGLPDEHLINHLIWQRKVLHNKVILYTCRTGDHLKAAVDYCKAAGLEFNAVNENLPELIEAYGSDSRKISADIYIDDRACHPGSVSWSFFNEFRMSVTDLHLYKKGDKTT